VHRIFENLRGMAAIAVVGVLVLAGTAHHAKAQEAAPAQRQKKVKDQGEYDLYNSTLSSQNDKAKQLQYLNQWVEKYPDSDYQEEQARLYDSLGQPAKAMEMAQKILAKDSKNLIALTIMATDIQKVPNPSPDQLSNAQKAAQAMLENLDALKPSTVTDDQWKQVKPNLQALANATIEWVYTKPARDATEKKDLPGAEAAWRKLVQDHPDNGQYSYQLGSVLVSEKDPNKYPEAIYEIARALEIPGLTAQTRPQVEAYLKKIFDAYHGSDDAELMKLRQLAKASPLPPPDFQIKTAAQIAAEKEEEFRKSNPALALWMGVKKELTDTGGEQYFANQLKGTMVGGTGDIPKLRGVIVEAKPACRSKELLVAVPLPDVKPPYTPEMTLRLDMPLKGKPMEGAEIRWQGEPKEFTQQPFMLTMDVETASVDGLNDTTMAACAAPAGKKGTTKKK
jgi:tetratricopeptide (TPR) repeat protein